MASVRYLGARWRWSKSKVERFLEQLRKMQRIETLTETGITVVRLINYGLYNTYRDSDRDSHEDARGTVAGQSRDKSKNVKNKRTKEPPNGQASLALVGGEEEKVIPTTEAGKFINSLFGHRETTGWSPKEVAKFKELSRRGVLTQENLALLGDYYAAERAKSASGGKGVHRRDLMTFLNNFDGELDRAHGAAEEIAGSEEDDGYREV